MNNKTKIFNEKNNKFLKFCNLTVTIIMVILTGYLFLLSIFGTSMINVYVGYESTVYLTDNPLFHISAIILILLLGYLIASSPRLKTPSSGKAVTVLIAIHGIIAVIMLIAIYTCNYLPVTAQYWTLDAANHLITADYSFWERSGFSYIYPWLNSLTLFLVPEVFFFGMNGGTIAFRIINLGILIFASYSLYGFCKETKMNGVMTSILFIFYLPLELYVFFVYGNIACLSFSLSAIWLAVRYLKHGRKKDAVLCTLTISIAVLFKDNALIVLTAILLVICIYGITARQWKKLIWLPIFIAVYLFCNMIVNVTIEEITGETVPSGMDVYGHLTMGMSEGRPDTGGRADGWYNNFTFDTLAACEFDYDLYHAVTKEAFLQRSEVFWNNPSYVINFFAHKTASQWNNPTFQSIWIHQQMIPEEDRAKYSLYIDGSFANMLFYFILNLLQSILLFGSLCFFVFDSRKAPLSSLIPAITFIGGFLFLLFWEAKAQYTLMFFVMLFPYAITGLINFTNSLFHLIKSGNSLKWYRTKEMIFLSIVLCIVLLLSAINSKSVSSTIKLGTADADALYDYYLEQNVNYYEFMMKN